MRRKTGYEIGTLIIVEEEIAIARRGKMKRNHTFLCRYRRSRTLLGKYSNFNRRIRTLLGKYSNFKTKRKTPPPPVAAVATAS